MKKIISFVMLCLFAMSSQASFFKDYSRSYTKTKYPIILVHGILGYDDIGPIDHFFGIPQSLERGGATVYVAEVSPLNGTEVRGEQLIRYIQRVLIITGAKKVNLIGHSHGGPTIRYVASVEPEMVASVTSIAGVNKGTQLAEIGRSIIPAGSIAEQIAFVKSSKVISAIIGVLSGGSILPADGLALLNAMSLEGASEFNKQFPAGIPTSACGEGDYVDANGIYYYSWAGDMPSTNLFDPDNALFVLTGALYGSPNDGAVGVCSTHLGKVIRDDYKMNHQDLVNQTFGIHHLFETDPKTLYRQHANRLKRQGL